jgi:hypothetical protein
MSTEILNQMKMRVESMTKIHQIEVLKIITTCSNVSVNENKSGVYINLSYIEPNVIQEIQNYLNFVDEQEQLLNPAETAKQDIKNTYFNNNEDILTVYR